MRERTLTLPSELPCWELKSQWTPECSENDCKGQNPMAQRVLHIFGKLLKFKCLEWARVTHLDIWNTSYDQKKGQGSNWQFDSRPLKVEIRPDLLACRRCATYCWKVLNKIYNFILDCISIGGLHTKLWGPEITRVPKLTILGLPRQKAIWMWVSWRKVYYKGGRWWLPPSPDRGESCEFKFTYGSS